MNKDIKFSFEDRKTLEDYSAEEVQFINQMRKVLNEFNNSIPEGYEGEINAPDYTRDQMLIYSHYHQLLIKEKTKLS